MTKEAQKRLDYLRAQAKQKAYELWEAADYLYYHIGLCYGNLATAATQKAMIRQRAEAEAMRDFCRDFWGYMRTPESQVQIEATPAEAMDGLLEALGPAQNTRYRCSQCGEIYESDRAEGQTCNARLEENSVCRGRLVLHDMSGPDGPVADSDEGYTILRGQEPDRDFPEEEDA